MEYKFQRRERKVNSRRQKMPKHSISSFRERYKNSVLKKTKIKEKRRLKNESRKNSGD